MKVIIAGSRTIESYAVVVDAINNSGFTITEVVSGGALGVDELGERWAVANEIPIRRFRADWKKHGNSAGPIRNGVMARYADALVLVWDGTSRGSASMKREAIQAGLPIHERVVG